MIENHADARLYAELSEELLSQLNDLTNREIHLESGQLLQIDGDPTENFYLMLRGKLEIQRRGDGRKLILEVLPGGDSKSGAAGGAAGDPEASTTPGGEERQHRAPLLLATAYVSSATALAPSHLLQMPADAYLEWVAGASPANSVIVPVLVQRVKTMETLLLHGEKMAALGKMAAGLTHELNNPASAASRAASQLSEAVKDLREAASNLIKHSLTPEQVGRLAQIQADASQRTSEWCLKLETGVRDPLKHSSMENQISDWMEEHGVRDSWRLAPGLADAGFDPSWLDSLADVIPGPAVPDALVWLAQGVFVNRLVNEIDQSTGRISELVAAVKSYSYMDRAPVDDVDVHEGIESTLILLSHGLRNIEVVRKYDPNLPRIHAYAGELNQVWTNLLDNAADALEGKGRITIRTWQEDDSVMVEIADNGPGIPPEVQPRIFEPFFTTKSSSKGMGLGLDITYRIVVSRHRGDIRVQSVPGDTRFQVCLPLNGAKGR